MVDIGKLERRLRDAEKLEKYNDIYPTIIFRFPGAKFCIRCFDTVEEIENKVLNDTDEYILYCDFYTVHQLGKQIELLKDDFYIVRRKEGNNCIYYKDVIDAMIKNDYKRDDTKNRYLENIKECYERRNRNSIKVYSTFWGS